ncbi:MAG: glycerol-3-phosphate 1-O-acyltransferase PlsY [Oscillospiraceae bacterium]
MGLFVVALAVAALCGYLLGSVNCSVLVSRMMYGEDVRTKGSGNAGMTNVLRSFGKKGAALAFVGDTVKGALGVFLGRWALMLLAPDADPLYGMYIAGICTIVGHAFPLYFGFKGGKGVSTSLGVILAIDPLTAIILLAIFLVILAVSKMVSLGSVLGIMFYPVLTLVFGLFVYKKPVLFATICSAVVAALVVFLHRENIKRILNGTEYKFGQKKE